MKEKYRRTYFAVRAFQVGIVYLVVGGIGFLFGFAQSAGKNSHAVPIYPNYIARTVFFLIFAGYMSVELIAVRDQSRYERKDWDTDEFGANRRYACRTAGCIALAVLFSFIWFEAVLVFLPTSDTWATVLFMAVTAIPLLIALHSTACRSNALRRELGSVHRRGWREVEMWLDTTTVPCRPMRPLLARLRSHRAVVTGVDSPLARIAAASAGPILFLGATVVQRTGPRAAASPEETSDPQAPAPAQGVAAAAEPTPADAGA